MDTKRSGYQTYLYDFVRYDIDVVCSKCNHRALVKTNKFAEGKIVFDQVKFICTSCGSSKFFSEKPGEEKTIRLGVPSDPFFLLPLWFMMDCCGELLWAYNLEHLDFLKEHVEAKLRERNGKEMINKSIASRLPKWMTSKKNREEILKGLENLRHKE